ncbi:C40 family peptidase [Clostridium sp. Sa3CVN1]|uniref:C40 family peptidase n=1 Tax=Clostridium cibarium TaxID=2762247 RepID=A0ABR8PQ37_9CLOT|nr:C40 family peptidase [Clostridium cibarium]
MNHLEKPYVYGETGPDRFDCSGLALYVYKKVANIDIGRDTYAQVKEGREVSQSELQPGDLVFPHA